MHVAHKLVNGFCRKKGQDRIQETYQPIKLNGLEEIRGIYSRAEDKVADLNAEKDPSKVFVRSCLLVHTYSVAYPFRNYFLFASLSSNAVCTSSSTGTTTFKMFFWCTTASAQK